MTLSPKDMPAAKAKRIPKEVIAVVDEQLAEKWDGSQAILLQTDLADLIAERMDIHRQDVFARKWLDFEDVYRAEGWSVIYDKPAYCESYEASFTFKAA